MVGASYRYVQAIGKESFNSGVIALDRRDISVGAMPNDIIDSPFDAVPPGAVALGWENDVRSNTGDAGLFAVSDIAWKQTWICCWAVATTLIMCARSIWACWRSSRRRRGAARALHLLRQPQLQDRLGLVPYVTNAKSAAIEIGQAEPGGDVAAGGDDWLSTPS